MGRNNGRTPKADGDPLTGESPRLAAQGYATIRMGLLGAAQTVLGTPRETFDELIRYADNAAGKAKLGAMTVPREVAQSIDDERELLRAMRDFRDKLEKLGAGAEARATILGQ